jgi:hypothetical protein
MWLVVYKREIRAGTSEGEAVALADQAVRFAHGSTAVTARPAFMRGGPVARATMPFYTFFNDMLQRQNETAWRAKDIAGYRQDGNYLKAKEEMNKVATGIWSYFLFPAIVEQAISPIVFNQQDGYIKMGAEILARDFASSWPIARDIVAAFLGGRDPSVSLYQTGYKAITDWTRDLSRGEVSLSREHAGKFIKHTAIMAGATLGVANAQMGRWGEGAYDYATGVKRPHGPAQWYTEFRGGDIKHPEEVIPFYKRK